MSPIRNFKLIDISTRESGSNNNYPTSQHSEHGSKQETRHCLLAVRWRLDVRGAGGGKELSAHQARLHAVRLDLDMIFQVTLS
jgi:hypothetical protein